MVTVSRSAQSSVALNFSRDSAAWCEESPGRITVASAIANTPIGNSTRRSAAYIQVTLPTMRKDAMIVSSSSDTCATEEPKIPGSIRRAMRFTPSCARSKRGRGRSRSACMAGKSATSCTMPATNTPAASTRWGRSKCGATTPAATIMTTLSSTWLKAGMANRP